MKTCSTCKVEQPVINFNTDKTKKDLLKSDCKDCAREVRRRSRQKKPQVYRGMQEKYRANNKEKLRQNRYRHIHKIDYSEFLEILASQGNVCKICKKSEPNQEDRNWVVDHDHNCCPKDKSCAKCRRGILCQSCNKALGFAKDNPEVLRAAADYLEAYEREKNANV